jgi:pimeloyl-ACP methyl ester carboxylesterase
MSLVGDCALHREQRRGRRYCFSRRAAAQEWLPLIVHRGRLLRGRDARLSDKGKRGGGSSRIMIVVDGIEQWWSDGERAGVRLGDIDRTIFVRQLGAGATMTLLHGFPSSSHDWAKVAALLADHHALLLPDFLGFGASDKPVDHDYSIHEQADLVEALWAREGINSTVVVAHDYAVSVVQELLARRLEGALAVELVAVHLLNGGLYPDLHRPEPTQTALLDAEQGPRISAQLTEELFVGALRPTFAEGFDAAADSADIWRATSRNSGQLIAHRLIRYMTDRAMHGERWVWALETTDVPLAFVWGMLDPVSGAHVAQRIRERLPDAPFTALNHVGHWPPLEAPQLVAAAVLGA